MRPFWSFLALSQVRNLSRSKVYFSDLEVCCDWSRFFSCSSQQTTRDEPLRTSVWEANSHAHPRNSFAVNKINRLQTNACQRLACIIGCKLFPIFTSLHALLTITVVLTTAQIAKSRFSFQSCFKQFKVLKGH